MTESPIPDPESRLVALVAGEDSGDLLGADLATALARRLPGVKLVGVGGPRMRAAGVETWHDIAELSVMGIAEVLRHLPRLLRLRRELARRLVASRPDVVVGIDAPDFNLGLEKRLKRAGIRTAHYVSPSVWAWRENRARELGHSADRVLCLFPMEPPIYARHGVDARFVGHPLADTLPLQPDRAGARRRLGLPADARVLAVLPGSRGSEVERLGATFLEAAQRVAQALPGLRIIVPAANAKCRAMLEGMLSGPGKTAPRPTAATDGPHEGSTPARAGNATPPSPVLLLDGHAHDALVAADAALVASGTAALEAMLAKCPMVVGYRIAPLTYHLVRALKMMKTDVYSLPNVLAGRRLVPELMQDDCRADRLAAAVTDLFADAPARETMIGEFSRLHAALRGPLDGGNAAGHAAEAVVELLQTGKRA